MNLDQVQKSIVDLRRSDWDKEKSKPKEGKYEFRSKVYLKKSDYNDSAIRPDFVLKFIGYDDDDLSTLKRYRQEFHAEVVTTDDPFFPELAELDSEGHYRYWDTIMVKIPLKLYLEKILRDRSRYDAGHKLTDANFNTETKAGGVDLDISKYL